MKVATGRRAGFTLFELLVVVCLVGVLVSVVLDRMLRYQELAEKAAMEQTVAAFRSALVIQVGARILRGGLQSAAELADQNPTGWLAEIPHNYVGALYDPTPDQVPRGSWYYDLKSKELIYKPKLTRYLIAGAGGAPRIRYRAVVQIDGQGPAGVRELSVLGIRPSEPVQWFPEF
jgi:general secretion pathway protein G